MKINKCILLAIVGCAGLMACTTSRIKEVPVSNTPVVSATIAPTPVVTMVPTMLPTGQVVEPIESEPKTVLKRPTAHRIKHQTISKTTPVMEQAEPLVSANVCDQGKTETCPLNDSATLVPTPVLTSDTSHSMNQSAGVQEKKSGLSWMLLVGGILAAVILVSAFLNRRRPSAATAHPAANDSATKKTVAIKPGTSAIPSAVSEKSSEESHRARLAESITAHPQVSEARQVEAPAKANIGSLSHAAEEKSALVKPVRKVKKTVSKVKQTTRVVKTVKKSVSVKRSTNAAKKNIISLAAKRKQVGVRKKTVRKAATAATVITYRKKAGS